VDFIIIIIIIIIIFIIIIITIIIIIIIIIPIYWAALGTERKACNLDNTAVNYNGALTYCYLSQSKTTASQNQKSTQLPLLRIKPATFSTLTHRFRPLGQILRVCTNLRESQYM
jgi:hypothetical protein